MSTRRTLSTSGNAAFGTRRIRDTAASAGGRTRGEDARARHRGRPAPSLSIRLTQCVSLHYCVACVTPGFLLGGSRETTNRVPDARRLGPRFHGAGRPPPRRPRRSLQDDWASARPAAAARAARHARRTVRRVPSAGGGRLPMKDPPPPSSCRYCSAPAEAAADRRPRTTSRWPVRLRRPPPPQPHWRQPRPPRRRWPPRRPPTPRPAPTPNANARTCNGAPAPTSCQVGNGSPPATAQCRDGLWSCSQTRQGTCSTHGGPACFVCPGPLC